MSVVSFCPAVDYIDLTNLDDADQPRVMQLSGTSVATLTAPTSQKRARTTEEDRTVKRRRQATPYPLENLGTLPCTSTRYFVLGYRAKHQNLVPFSTQPFRKSQARTYSKKQNVPGLAFQYLPRVCSYQDRGPCYRQGALLRVQRYGEVNDVDAVGIMDILQTDRLDHAVLSAAAWDQTWLLGDLNLSQIYTTWVVDPSIHIHPHKMQSVHQVPLLAKSCTLHGKFMLLFRDDDYLRIAIPTGNLVRQDWGAGPPRCGTLLGRSRQHHTLDNAVWVIDLPLRTELDPSTDSSAIPFRRDLLAYLHCLGLERRLLQRIEKYDFTACTTYGFVYTSGLSQTSGLDSLQQSVRELGLDMPDLISSVDYYTSSIGTLSRPLISQLFRAIGNYKQRLSLEEGWELMRQYLRICYPSRMTVEAASNSKAATSLFAKPLRKGTVTYQMLEETLVDLPPGAPLSHIKMLRVDWIKSAYSQTTGCLAQGWMLVGSQNLSRAAWGSGLGGSGNFECSVLVPDWLQSNQHNDLNGIQIGSNYSPTDMWYRQ